MLHAAYALQVFPMPADATMPKGGTALSLPIDLASMPAGTLVTGSIAVLPPGARLGLGLRTKAFSCQAPCRHADDLVVRSEG